MLSIVLLNLEKINKATPVGLKGEARKKVELSTLDYSSPVRRHHEQSEREAKTHSATQKIHSLNHPAHFAWDVSRYFLKKYIYLFF